MSRFTDCQPQRLHLPVILLEVAVLILGLSVIALTRQSAAVWLVGVMLVVLHTLLFYRLGKLSGRLAADRSRDFFRGFKRGLLGRSDPESDCERG